MKRLSTLPLAGLLVLFAASLAARPTAATGTPPGVMVGTKLYGLVLDEPTARVLASSIDSTEVTVKGVEGAWLLLETPHQESGPQWVNSSQLLSFRTRR